MAQQLLFYLFAAIITFCSIMVITVRNPVTAAIYLVMDLFLMAGVYAMMEAHFVAATQILVYAGAIVVLFLFVIMLVDLREEDLSRVKLSSLDYLTIILTTLSFLGVAGMIAFAETPSVGIGGVTTETIEQAGGNTYVVGMTLFTKFIWPFELASVLILLAIIASIVIAKKEEPSKMSQAKRKKEA